MTATLLAFDTATDHLSIALAAGGVVHVHEGAGGAQASATLIPAILALLARAGVTLRELDAIAFGRGPGAFTGLRTACSVAQGLAYGAAKPVLPIDTLLAVAEDARRRVPVEEGPMRVGAGDARTYTGADARPHGAAAASPQAEAAADHPHTGAVAARSRADAHGAPTRGDGNDGHRIWVAMDARMNEIYAAQYAWGDDGRWSVLDAPMLIGPDALDARWQAEPPQHVAGNALAAFAGRAWSTGAARLSPDALPRAAAMLPLAQAMWADGAAVDAAAALPLYLRDKVAQTTVERAAARAAKDALEAAR